MPDILYFDLGNVLVHFDHDRMCRQISSVTRVPVEQVRRVLLDGDMLHQWETGVWDDQALCEQFCTATKSDIDPAKLLRAASDIFELNVDLVPVITQLVAGNYRLGIISNTCQAHWEFCSSGRFQILARFFHPVVLSYEAGCVKPDPRIFALAAEAAGVEPSAIFYTDDIAENVAAARQAGLDAVVFTGARDYAAALRERGVRFNY